MNMPLKLKTKILDSGAEKDLAEGDPAYALIMEKVGTYSITPRTLTSKTLLVSDINDHHPLRSVEEYEYCGNKVLRFCINAGLISADPEGTILGEGSAVPKTSVSGSSTGYIIDVSKAAILHKLEKEILTCAIKYLNDASSGSGTQTVLVDLFERNNGVAVNLDPQGHPIIHTVVLCKGGESILVVDPSNFTHSSHLSNTNFNDELVRQALPPIETIHKKLQIYKPDTKVGFGNAFDKYRDCTDVAVKLAFGFNLCPIIAFDEKSIKTHPTVVRVSNIKAIDNSIIEEDVPSHIKQTSNPFIQEAFRDIESLLLKQINSLDTAGANISKCTAQMIRTTHRTILTTPNTNSTLLQNLLLLSGGTIASTIFVTNSEAIVNEVYRQHLIELTGAIENICE